MRRIVLLSRAPGRRYGARSRYTVNKYSIERERTREIVGGFSCIHRRRVTLSPERRDVAHKGEHATARRHTTAPQPAAEFVALLHAAQLSAAQVQHIQRHYGAAAVTTVRAHPYRLAQDIDGVSF